MVLKEGVVDASGSSGIISCTKGVGSLLIAYGLGLNELTTEKVTIWIEKQGENVYIANKMELKKFLGLSILGADASYADAVFHKFVCELTRDEGAIHLDPNEELKIEFTGLIETKPFFVRGIESNFQSAYHPIEFESLNMHTDSVTRDFPNNGQFDMALVQCTDSTTFEIEWENGRTQYADFEELFALNRQIDPIIGVTSAGAIINGITNHVYIPMAGVKTLRVRKDAGELLTAAFRYAQRA